MGNYFGLKTLSNNNNVVVVGVEEQPQLYCFSCGLTLYTVYTMFTVYTI